MRNPLNPGSLQAMAQQLAEESDAVFPLLQALPLAQSSLLLEALTAAGVSYVGPAPEAARSAAHKLRANLRIAELGFPAMPVMALERSDVASEVGSQPRTGQEGSAILLHICG